jgi:HSP20 family molecular chaperone IbpA
LYFSSGLLAQGPANKDDSQASPNPQSPQDGLSDDQKLLRDLRKNLLGDRRLLEKYFQKDFLDRVDKMFEDSMRDFGGDDFDQVFRSFQDSFQSMGSGLNTRWKETKEGKVLVVDGAVAKGGNFDLKVKEGIVSLSGTLEKDLGTMGKRVMSFSNSFPVPQGTDPDKIRIENGDEGLLVIFPWTEKRDSAVKESPQNTPSQASPRKSVKPKRRPNVRPLEKDADEPII